MQPTTTIGAGSGERADNSRRPLCVDLDGTLLKTDLLWEAALALAKTNVRALLTTPFWLLKGRAHLKRQIAESGTLDPRLLPYRQEVLSLISEERARGRKIVLVSAADEIFAREVAAHLGCFDEVIASDGTRNLKGSTKAELLTQRFGAKGFDYIGDHDADLHVWRAAQAGVVVSANRRLLRRAEALGSVRRMKLEKDASWKTWINAMRLHQWSKNVLVLVPVITSHRLEEPAILLLAAIAFFAFGLVSSSVYLVNDLLDLAADRGHARKRSRPFASGSLALPSGVMLAGLLLVSGLSLASFGGFEFLAMLVGYYGANIAYSSYLKRIVALDVLILAGFYTLRIYSGGAATGIGVSAWLLAFSMFFFLSLALVKRYSELRGEAPEAILRETGRGYVASDLPALGSFGISSGFISVLVLVLYVMSPEVTLLYLHPQRLLFVCPLLLYWIGRIWMRTTRGTMHEDPVVFALTDRISYGLGLLAGLAVMIAAV